MAEGEQERRADYPRFLEIPTRWMDNDIYGHVNNVIYYSYFDTVINQYLIEAGGLDIHKSTIIGIAVESQCRFHRSLEFPDVIDAGLRVGRLGNTSVRYEIGLFRRGVEEPDEPGLAGGDVTPAGEEQEIGQRGRRGPEQRQDRELIEARNSGCREGPADESTYRRGDGIDGRHLQRGIPTRHHELHAER